MRTTDYEPAEEAEKSDSNRESAEKDDHSDLGHESDARVQTRQRRGG